MLALSSSTLAAEDSPLGLSFTQSRDLRLIYFTELGFLAPHAVRTFSNSVAWQRRVLGWEPSQPVTVLMKDFSDYGGAAAWA